MLLKEKKKIHRLMNTLSEVISHVPGYIEKPSTLDDSYDSLEVSLETSINVISNTLEQLEKETVPPQKSLAQLLKIREKLILMVNNPGAIDKQNIKKLKRAIDLAQHLLSQEVEVKMKVLFLPYKLSMWDSLETIYHAALKDNTCEVQVVPIPYYELERNERVLVYEGNEFPEDIQVTHYNDYHLEEENPDIIYVHNIYDHYNTLTQVHEAYFTDNLKKHTDMLVYVPYHISSFIDGKEKKYLAYHLPSISNVDKVILAGTHVKQAAVRDGVSEDKLLVLGSPKIDYIVNAMKEDPVYPQGWKEKLQDKTVFLLNTGCLFFAHDPFYKVGLLSNFLNIPHIVENSIIIWRPHPLTRISIKKYTPGLLSYYDTLIKEYIQKDFIYHHVLMDETKDYMPALMAADILISDDGSLLRSFLLTGKKVLFYHRETPLNPSFLSQASLPSDSFHYFFDHKQPWSEAIKALAKGIDSLTAKRSNMVERVYVNTDGTSGEKIHEAIMHALYKK